MILIVKFIKITLKNNLIKWNQIILASYKELREIKIWLVCKSK